MDLLDPLLAPLGCALKEVQILQSAAAGAPALDLALCHGSPGTQEAHPGVLGMFPWQGSAPWLEAAWGLEPAEMPLLRASRTGCALLLSVPWGLGKREKHNTLTE